jgi:geranylgeranyl transferase type-1 subunit beta
MYLSVIDLYHSYLGLATLAMMKEPGLKDIDPALCVSVQARGKLEKSIKEAITPVKVYWKHGYPFMSLETDPHHARRMEEDEGPPQFLIDRLKEKARQGGADIQNGTNGTVGIDDT